LRQEETYYRNTAVVPTALERAGDFSQSARKPIDPTTGALFPGNVIPADRFDPTAKAIQDQFIPVANLPNSFFEVSRPDPLETDEATIKLDHSFSPSRSLAVSYFFLTGRDTLSGSGNIPWVDRGEAAQPERRRHVDAEPDDVQPAADHLHAAVRRPSQ
jgi:hypothetical protein